MVHQHFKLIDVLSAAENIILGLEGKLNIKEASRKIEEICEKYGFEVDPKQKVKDACINIAKNPIILGILAGALWSVLRLPMPTILTKTVSSLGGLTTPLGLMAMGAAFNWSEAKSGMGPAFAASFMKLIGLCTLFLPVAVLLGFREAELIAILVMLGSSTTVSSYVMARNMGHSGVLSSSIVAITTLGSAFSLTFWLYVLKTLALI